MISPYPDPCQTDDNDFVVLYRQYNGWWWYGNAGILHITSRCSNILNIAIRGVNVSAINFQTLKQYNHLRYLYQIRCTTYKLLIRNLPFNA